MRFPSLFFIFLLVIPAVAHGGDFHRFRTPSDNIHCLAEVATAKNESTYIACDIRNTSGNPPARPRPKDCDLDWGQRFEVGSNGSAALICASDWVGSDTSPVLGYGSSLRFGRITCSSSKRGLECKNKAGGGFFLSRKVQRIF
ncbi:MAG: hypothetical protein K0U74_14085 [Alphaproteobacteria bacterium]|nr:hypothetical protein [Alphaproteobacteria bacterium]